MQSIDHLAPGFTFVCLLVAACLEVTGDSFFQAALHRSSGTPRWISFAIGAGVLALYGLVVNLPHWDFGRLLGVYIAFFFLVAQVIAKVRFHQQITTPLVVGGAMILCGGMVISLWRV